MLLLLILYPLCSCGGNVTVPLGVIIYIYKDNSNSFMADELKRLRITSNGIVVGDSLPDGTKIGGLGIDENGKETSAGMRECNGSPQRRVIEMFICKNFMRSYHIKNGFI